MIDFLERLIKARSNNVIIQRHAYLLRVQLDYYMESLEYVEEDWMDWIEELMGMQTYLKDDRLKALNLSLIEILKEEADDSDDSETRDLYDIDPAHYPTFITGISFTSVYIVIHHY